MTQQTTAAVPAKALDVATPPALVFVCCFNLQSDPLALFSLFHMQMEVKAVK